MDYKNLTAPCGIDCFNCEIYKDNITDELRNRIAPYMKKSPVGFQCEGCRVSGCLMIPDECETKKCVEAKSIDFCCDCESFPCNNLHPCSDGADKLPQNYKLYNLCKIKAIGVDEWAKEAHTTRQKYFKGKMKIGSGPSLEDIK